MRRIDLQHLREYLLALGNMGDEDDEDEFDELESNTSNSSRGQGNIPTTRSSSSSRSVTRNESSSSAAAQSINVNSNTRRTPQQEHQLRYQSFIQQKREELESNDIYNNIQKQTGKSNKSIPKNVFSNLMSRTHLMGRSTSIQANCKLSSPFLPSDPPEIIDSFDHQVFCGRFSDDGTIFMSACQDQNIRLYSIDNIQQSLLRKKMAKPFKTIAARDVGWSVVDCHYSPDQRFIIYSSWSPYIHLCTVGESFHVENTNSHQGQEALDLSPYSMRFCPFSIRFSPDSKEILAGASDSCLYLYDIERKRLVLRVENAHDDDINTVSFADQNSHIFFSGSDDSLIKVWDRRTFRNNSLQPVGIFCGHTSGLTYISSKQDGTYFISNGKDQCMKLWDIRKMKSSMDDIPKRTPTWDYRYMFRSTNLRMHPQDLSIMTYRGHSVLQTLIRCHFSPIATTGQSYLYTGSSDGKVYIYDILTGNVVKTLSGHTSIVRDVSWHPNLPLLISSSWDTTTRAFSYHPKDITATSASTFTTHPTAAVEEEDDDDEEPVLRRGAILLQNEDDDEDYAVFIEEETDGEEEDDSEEEEDEEME